MVSSIHFCVPVLVELYNKYKGDKFEILGVDISWDYYLEETLKTIEKHSIPWPQILNVSNIPTNLYRIRGIPHNILFDPDGTIITSNLRRDDLRAKVAEVMQ